MTVTKRINKVISVLLSFIMIISVLPINVFAAPVAVTVTESVQEDAVVNSQNEATLFAEPSYSTKTLPFVPLNADSASDSAYLKKYLKSDNNGAHALNYLFEGKRTTLNKSFGETGSDSKTNLTKNISKSGSPHFSFKFSYSLGSTEKAYINSNIVTSSNGKTSYGVRWVAPFKVQNDHKKISWGRNRYSGIKVKVLTYSSGSTGKKEYLSQDGKNTTNAYKGDVLARFGYNHSTKLTGTNNENTFNNPDYQDLKKNTTELRLEGETYGGHEASLDFYPMPIFMVDVLAPRVTKISVTNTSDKEVEYFGEGDTVRFNVYFNEPIKTYNNKASALNDITLKFQIEGIANTVFEAKCVSLKDDKLVFEWKVDEYDPDNKNTRAIPSKSIKSIESSQNWAEKKQRDSIVFQYNKSSSTKTFSPDKNNFSKLYNVSVITDLAGNSVDLGASTKTFSNKNGVKVNNVEPTIESVEISAQSNFALSILHDNNYPYVNSNTTIRVHVNLSHPIYAQSGNKNWYKDIELETTVKNSDGSSAEFTCSTYNEGSTVLEFSTLLTSTQSSNGEIIKITGIKMPSNEKIVDLYGNEFDPTVPDAVIGEYTIDTEAPVIEIGELVKKQTSQTEFYIPFHLSDELSGVAYDGELDGFTLQSSFILTANTEYEDALPFTYRVSAFSTTDENDVFINNAGLHGNAYVQLEDTIHYIHIRLDEKKLTSLGASFDTLTLKVYALDNVLNNVIVEKTFDFVGDFGTTEIYQIESSFGPSADETAAEGQISVGMYDASGVETVEYAWLEDGEELDESAEWYTDDITDITHDEESWQGTFHIRGLELGETHSYRLYLKVTDEAGNESIGGGYLLNIYVGDADFKYETTTADTADTYHILNIYYPDSADKTITATVQVDRDGDGREDDSQEIVFEYDETNDVGYDNLFDFVTLDLYGKVTVTMTCETTLGVSATATETFYFFSEFVGFTEAHDLKVTTIDTEGNEVIITENTEYAGPDGAPIVRNSLEGTAFKIEIGDNKIYNPFGLSDIIFEECFVTFYDMETGEEIAHEFLYEAHTNVIEIPHTLFEPGKYYGAEIVICTYGSNGPEYVYENIIFDNIGITLSGVESVGRTAINPYTNEEIIFEEDVSLEDVSSLSVAFNISGAVRDDLVDSEYSKAVFTAMTGYTTVDEESGETTVTNGDSSSTSNRVYMKIWNETLGETREDAEWIELSLKEDSEYEFSSELYFVPEDAQLVPNNSVTVTDGTNVFRYFFKTANGFVSNEQIANVVAISLQPSLEFETSDLGNWSQDATFTILSTSGYSSGEEYEIYADTDVEAMEALVENFITDGTVTVTEEGTYWFGVSDDYHNITWYEFIFDMMDNTPPEISEFRNQDYPVSEFYIDITAADDKTLAEDLTIYVTVDEDFASDYGLAEDAVLFDYTGLIYPGSEGENEKLGYSIFVPEDSPNEFYSSLTGVYPYDMTRPDTEEERTFTLHVIDAAGNEATATVKGIQQNLVPGVYAVGGEGGIFSVEFNSRVKILSPEYDYTALENYYFVKEYSSFQMMPWIYKDGTYSIRCVDAWGYEFTTDLVVDSFGDIYGLDVHFSEDEPTNEDVYVTVDATQNPYMYIDYTTIPEWQEYVSNFEVSEVITDSDGNAKKVTYRADQNGLICLTLMPYDSFNEDDEHLRAKEIYVTNINKTPLEIGVDYSASASIDEETNTTGGNVKATVYSLDNRILNPIEGDTSFTFTYGGPQSYIFKVRDDYGNIAEITANNPYVITNIVEENDEEAPDYGFDVLITKFGVQEYYDSFMSDSEILLPAFAENLTFVFHAIDASTVSFSVENKGAGVDVLGNMVTVDGNTSFTMVLTDAAGNETRVPINVNTYVDTLPKGMVIYENNPNNGTVRAFINTGFEENEGRDVIVVGSMGLGFDADSGMYYRDFYSNGSYIFNLMDNLGITAAITATVDNIDDSTPVGKVVRSSPGIFEGEQWKQIDDSLTRQNVSMTVSFTKDSNGTAAYLRSIEAEILDEKGSLDDLIIQNYGNEAVIIFKENAKVKLTFSAVNGRVGTLELPEVDFINKTAPIVEITDVVLEKSGEATKSVTLEFTADRNVFFINSGNYSEDSGAFTANTNHTYKIFANGDYEFRFVDTAGNTASVTYTVDVINSEPPVITLSDLNEGSEYTNKDVTAKVSLDMDGTIKHFGQEIAVSADVPVEIAFPYNGYYEIIATGVNGLTSREMVNIRMIDKDAPVIGVADSSVYALLGSDYEELLADVIAYDDISGDVTDTVEITINDGNPITAEGTYNVTYTAEDKAGNVATVTAYLNIYGEDAISVSLNGIYAPPGALTVLKNTDEITVTTNLGEEPYKMYYAKGIRTSAQMKYEGVEFDGTITLNKDTYYTLYIVTQDRREYIARILIES